jgi:hypothetical protein
MMKRDECFAALARHLTDEIVIAVYSSAFDWLERRRAPSTTFHSAARRSGPARGVSGGVAWFVVRRMG